jgi:starch phosphorylase
MSNPDYTDLPSASQTSGILAEVALNLRWSWNHSPDQLWERLDPELWDLTHNPGFVLQTVSREKLRSVTGDPGFQKLPATCKRLHSTGGPLQDWSLRATGGPIHPLA